MMETPKAGAAGGGETPLADAERDFQADLNCAIRSAVPVLISAPAAIADRIARDIHRLCHAAGSFMAVDIDASLSPHAIRDAFAAAAPGGFLVLRNVDRLSTIDQDALRTLLGGGDVRLVATTGVNLFRLVEHGAFDEALFYRLNHIHLVPPAG